MMTLDLVQKVRCFIAADLPEKVKSDLANLQENLKKHNLNIKWVEPENIHLTLKFLGDVYLSDIEEIYNAMKKIGKWPPLNFFIKGLGVFPGIKKPRVLWTNTLGDNAKLEKIQQKLENRLYDSGFQKDTKDFKAHITIGRVKNKVNPKEILEVVEKFSGFETKEFNIDKISLYKSIITRKGPVYTRLETVKAAG